MQPVPPCDPNVPGYRNSGTLIKPFTFDALSAAVGAVAIGA